MQVTFTLRHGFRPPVYMNNLPIPTTDAVHYLKKILTKEPHSHLEDNTRFKLLRHLDTRSKLSHTQTTNIQYNSQTDRCIWIKISGSYKTLKQLLETTSPFPIIKISTIGSLSILIHYLVPTFREVPNDIGPEMSSQLSLNHIP